MSYEINKKTGKAVAWSFTTEIVLKLIVPIINIILARLLTPNAFGAVATINMVISFVEIFSDAGFHKYIIQHEFESEDELNKGTCVAFWTNISLSLLFVLCIFLFRDQIASFVGSPNMGNPIAIASISILAVSLSSIQGARFSRDLDFKSLFYIRIISSIIPLVITVPLAFLLRNFWALVIGTLCTNIFTAILLTIKSSWKPRFFYKIKYFFEMFSFTCWTLLEKILIWLTVNIDIFILGNILDDYYLGLYKTSMTTVNSYMALVSSAITPVLFSVLSRFQNDDKSFKETFWKFFKYTSVLVIPMSAGVFVFRDFVTSVLLGDQWYEAADFIGLWGLMGGIMILFSNFSSEVYRSKGNPKISMIVQGVHILFLIPAIMIAVNYSFTVLYTVRTILRLQIILVNLIVMRIMYKFRLSDMLKLCFPSFVSTVIMTLVGILLLDIYSGFLWQAASIIICIIVYFTSLFLLFPKLRKELFSFAISKIKKQKFSE